MKKWQEHIIEYVLVIAVALMSIAGAAYVSVPGNLSQHSNEAEEIICDAFSINFSGALKNERRDDSETISGYCRQQDYLSDQGMPCTGNFPVFFYAMLLAMLLFLCGMSQYNTILYIHKSDGKKSHFYVTGITGQFSSMAF